MCKYCFELNKLLDKYIYKLWEVFLVILKDVGIEFGKEYLKFIVDLKVLC